MAVVTTKSAAVTNRDATPVTFNDAIITGSYLKETVGMIETVSGDSIGSKYIMVSVPSNARIARVLLSCDDIGTTATADCGIYRTTLDGSAVVDADHFASAVVLNAGALSESNITHESGVYDIDDAEKPLWQALGLSADSKVMYDVVLTLTAAADAAGTIVLKVQYTI